MYLKNFHTQYGSRGDIFPQTQMGHIPSEEDRR